MSRHEYRNNTSYSLASCAVRDCLWLAQRYHMNFFTFSGILDFQIFLLLLTGTSECVSARYIESTVKDPDVVRFQRNTFRSCVRLIESSRDKRLCYDTSQGPIKSCLNEIFGGKEPSTCARVSILSRTIWYKAGNLVGYSS